MQKPASTTKEEPQRLSSVTTALRLLKTFSEQEPEIGISTLSKRMNIAKSTAHRLATTLLAEGMLEQNKETGKYRLGVELFTLGTMVRRRFDVTRQALPFLHALRAQAGETVYLAILDGVHVVHLFNLESDHAIRMRSYLGARKPAVNTAEGRALLAGSSPEVVAQVLKESMKSRTAGAGIDSQALLNILADIKRDGYAIDDEESEEGMRAIAAVVHDAGGQPVAAIGLGGPAQRLSKKTLKAALPNLLAAADGISSTLGYVK